MQQSSETQKNSVAETCNLVANKDAVNYEDQFIEYGKVAAQAKSEYLRVYKEMIAELRPSQLAPFAEALRKHEKTELPSWEVLTERMAAKLHENLTASLENFWIEFNVDNSIAALEMLKEKYKNFVGHNWNMQSKTAAERIRPAQIRLKDMKVRYLQRQLKFQNEQLDELFKQNKKHRERIQSLSQSRVLLHCKMQRYSKQYLEALPLIKEMKTDILKLY